MRDPPRRDATATVGARSGTGRGLKRMEYGIHLARLVVPPHDPRDACPRPWRRLLPAGPAVALYFGSEFCEDLLPDLDEADAFCALARDRDWEPTLLTPLVTPAGLASSIGSWRSSPQAVAAPAVVFNDWGVLGLLRERHAALPRRAGRLMNRSLRDPRAYRAAPDGVATHDASRFLRLAPPVRRRRCHRRGNRRRPRWRLSRAPDLTTPAAGSRERSTCPSRSRRRAATAR